MSDEVIKKRVHRPIFKRKQRYMAVRPIKKGIDENGDPTFHQPGEELVGIKTHILQMWHRQRVIAPLGSLWGELAIENYKQGSRFPNTFLVDADRIDSIDSGYSIDAKVDESETGGNTESDNESVENSDGESESDANTDSETDSGNLESESDGESENDSETDGNTESQSENSENESESDSQEQSAGTSEEGEKSDSGAETTENETETDVNPEQANDQSESKKESLADLAGV